MEYPNLGEHCSEESCRRLDFLPVRCDACQKTFCSNHMSYIQHNCPSAQKKNVQVPVCPLCNKPVPFQRGTLPDIAVGNHIDNDCRSDKAQDRKKVFKNRCSMIGCKTKEIVPVICNDCHQNFCFKHRHVSDHNCVGIKKGTVNKAAIANGHRQNQNRARSQKSLTSIVQGNMSEDEALARALQRSMEDHQPARRQTGNHNQQSCLLS